jgi:NAD(P)-dependent dehydrogenase (short-subunit alcohol dehydrogenase family)
VSEGFEGKVAIVTGSASGIGESTAGHQADAVATDIARGGGRALAVSVDVADDEQVEAMVRRTIEAFGRVDVLHNNAAALGDDVLGRDSDVINVPLDVWDRTMAISLRGPMLGCRHVVPHMLEQGAGSIVNTASTAGQRGDLSRVAYGSAKGGILAFTMYVATMYGKRGIRCNAVAPGLILSPIARRNMSPEDLAVSQANQLITHQGVPEDVAALVVFLASDDARFITGQTINADGGVQAHMASYSHYFARFESTGKGWP